MVAAGLRKGIWFVAANTMYLAAEKSGDLAPGVQAKVELTNWIITPVIGYNFVDVNILDDPDGFLDDILLNARKTYGAGIIHGDLSSFNIVVQKNGEVLLIDWPQAMATDHPNAEAFLERDVTNVLRHFERKFKVERSLEEAIAYVKG